MAKESLTILEVVKQNEKTLAKLNRTDWNFLRMFPGTPYASRVEVVGDQVSFGEDYVSIEEARQGFEWVVNQLGGKVKWRR